jgi:hypothetical protein
LLPEKNKPAFHSIGLRVYFNAVDRLSTCNEIVTIIDYA